MKKIKVAFIALLMMGFGAGLVNAQDKAAKKEAPAKQAPASTQHLKKDGTPDKRYKENKPAGEKKTETKAAKTESTPKAAPAKKTATKGKTEKAVK
jgi:hypothetical protein